MIAFIVVAALVVATLAVLAFVLLARMGQQDPAGIGSPSTSTSPPASSPSAQPLPGRFTTFAAPPTQPCDRHGKGHQQITAQVTWATTDSVQVWIAEGTEDASTAGGEQVPLSGNQDSVPVPLVLDCSSKSMTFTLTLVGNDGGHVNRTWTVGIESRH
jgi:hypothetical protein